MVRGLALLNDKDDKFVASFISRIGPNPSEIIQDIILGKCRSMILRIFGEYLEYSPNILNIILE